MRFLFQQAGFFIYSDILKVKVKNLWVKASNRTVKTLINAENDIILKIMKLLKCTFTGAKDQKRAATTGRIILIIALITFDPMEKLQSSDS